MARFVVGDDRSQSTLFPERLDDYLGEDNPVRAIDVLVDELDLAKLGFDGVEPEATGRPAYHPATLLKTAWVIRDRAEPAVGPTMSAMP
jgi:transposase